MTDEEMVRLCAEKVMGWKWVVDTVYATLPPKPASYCWEDVEGTLHGGTYGPFDPLTSDSDACMVMDRMVEQGWECRTYAMPYYSSLQPIAPGHKCEFAKLNMDEPCPVFRGYGPAGAKGRRRAIVMAALKAVGVSIPTPA